MQTLAGRTAVVTGGSGGIASAAAALLLGDGATVYLVARRLHKLIEVRDRLLHDAPNGHVEVIAADAMCEDEIRAAFEEAHRATARLDILVSTVGGISGMAPVATLDVASFRKDVEANLMSAVIALRHAAALMTEGGSVVFISSTAGGRSFPKLSGYAAAKAGLEHFAAIAADELGERGIRVNCVRAGMTRTDETAALFDDEATMRKFDGIVPLRRLGEPADIAAAIRYLAGPEANWVTGHVLSVDGGQMLRRNPVF